MQYEEHLRAHGYAMIPGTWYRTSGAGYGIEGAEFQSQADKILDCYEGLTLDPYSPGNRLRAYIQCKMDGRGKLHFGQFEPYFQTRAYNPDTGGIVRSYSPIPPEVIENGLFSFVIASDIRFVGQYGEIGIPSDTIIGIHLFRYRATPDSPAFSSPVWLHRDDEDIVFVHLLALSENACGADNIIARSARDIERVMKLRQLLDTFVVNHQKMHAVTPLWCMESSGGDSNIGNVCTRDVILVTFQKRGEDEK